MAIWLLLAFPALLGLGALIPHLAYDPVSYDVSRSAASGIGVAVALVVYVIGVPLLLAFRRFGFFGTVAGIVFLTVLLPLGLFVLFHSWWLLWLFALGKSSSDDPGWAGWKTMLLFDALQRSRDGR